MSRLKHIFTKVLEACLITFGALIIVDGYIPAILRKVRK